MKIVYLIISTVGRITGQRLGKRNRISIGRSINGKYIHTGDDVAIGTGWLLASYPYFAGQYNDLEGIFIGSNTKIGRNMTIYCGKKVSIGLNCLFGSNILITDNEHGMDVSDTPYHAQPLICKEIIIGDGTWVGEKCCILSGTHIGNKCIIGAGSIVKGVFPDECIIAGNPAKVIKQWNSRKMKWEKVVEND